MNILVTNWCNRRECDFCFEQSVAELKTAGHRQSASSHLFIAPERFSYLLQLAREWRSPRVCLLGGEPTQHPLIAQFIRGALELDLAVLVATNGVIGESCCRELKGILRSPSGGKLSFLVNAHLRADQPVAELDAIRDSLRWMKSSAALSLTVGDDGFDLLPLALLILEFRLNPVVRVSLAHPMLDGANAFAAREDFQRIGRALKAQGRELKEAGISLQCDCGFVACMFAGDQRAGERPEEAIARGLAELDECGIRFHSVCHPLLDVQPDLRVGHCLPLMPSHLVQLTPPQAVAREPLAERLSNHFREQLQTYLFDACESCGYRLSGQCVAGCMAHRLKLQRAAA